MVPKYFKHGFVQAMVTLWVLIIWIFYLNSRYDCFLLCESELWNRVVFLQQNEVLQDPYESMFQYRTWTLTRYDFSYDEKFYIHMCLMWWWEYCHIVRDPQRAQTYADAIAEQCELMPWMPDCAMYFDILWMLSN